MIKYHVGGSVVVFGLIPKSKYRRILTFFTFWSLFMQILLIFIRLCAFSAFILFICHFYKWKNAYIKDLYAWRILMNF